MPVTSFSFSTPFEKSSKALKWLPKMALASSLLVGSQFLTTPAALALDDGDKAAVEKIVREYLLSNPEILVEMQRELQAKQEASRVASAANALNQNRDAIFNSKYDVPIGDPNAPITVVEFFDYNCGFCKRSLELLQATVEKHPDVRFILKEFPILSQDSMDAHRVSLALGAIAPELYQEFHIKLMGGSGRATGESAQKLAVEMGADEAKLETAMKSDVVEGAIRETYQVAEAMGLNGTPAFIVGDEVVPGAISLQDLEGRYENLRKCGKTNC